MEREDKVEFLVTGRIHPPVAVLQIVPKDSTQQVTVEGFDIDEWGIRSFGRIIVDGCTISGKSDYIRSWKDRFRRAWAAIRYGR